VPIWACVITHLDAHCGRSCTRSSVMLPSWRLTDLTVRDNWLSNNVYSFTLTLRATVTLASLQVTLRWHVEQIKFIHSIVQRAILTGKCYTDSSIDTSSNSVRLISTAYTTQTLDSGTIESSSHNSLCASR